MILKSGLVALALVFFATPSRADEQKASESSLVTIMKHLNDSLSVLTKGLMTNSWPEVEKAAQEIADHDTADLKDVLRIATTIGSNMPKFKQFDHDVQEAAGKIASAAKTRDLVAASKALGVVIQNCVGCHASFRDQVQGSTK